MKTDFHIYKETGYLCYIVSFLQCINCSITK